MPTLTPEEILLDITDWRSKLNILGLASMTRYSNADRSVYLSIPLKLQSASYPDELLGDLASIGIVLLGAYNIDMSGEPGTMGLGGNTAELEDPMNLSLTAIPLDAVGYKWVYLKGPFSTTKAIPTSLSIMKTEKWGMSPDAYRTLFPEDTSMPVPSYRNTVAQ